MDQRKQVDGQPDGWEREGVRKGHRRQSAVLVASLHGIVLGRQPAGRAGVGVGVGAGNRSNQL